MEWICNSSEATAPGNSDQGPAGAFDSRLFAVTASSSALRSSTTFFTELSLEVTAEPAPYRPARFRSQAEADSNYSTITMNEVVVPPVSMAPEMFELLFPARSVARAERAWRPGGSTNGAL
jgi:hypothetical protein